MTVSTHATPTGVCDATTLVELLCQRRVYQPNMPAYTFLANGETVDCRLTFAEVDRQARAIGAKLQHAQAAGARVLLLYPLGQEYITAFFGCLYAGERLQAIVADANVGDAAK